MGPALLSRVQSLHRRSLSFDANPIESAIGRRQRSALESTPSPRPVSASCEVAARRAREKLITRKPRERHDEMNFRVAAVDQPLSAAGKRTRKNRTRTTLSYLHQLREPGAEPGSRAHARLNGPGPASQCRAWMEALRWPPWRRIGEHCRSLEGSATPSIGAWRACHHGDASAA